MTVRRKRYVSPHKNKYTTRYRCDRCGRPALKTNRNCQCGGHYKRLGK